MKTLVALAAILFALPSRAQGTLNFNNRTPTGDAPVTSHDGTGAGASVVAQLYLVTRSGASEVLRPLFPTTTFRTTSAPAEFYITPINPFVVDGVPPGQPATVRMVVYYGPSYEIAVKNNWEHGRSNDVLIPQLGGTLESGEIIPTPGLNGLEAFMFSPLDGLDPAPLAYLGQLAVEGDQLKIKSWRKYLYFLEASTDLRTWQTPIATNPPVDLSIPYNPTNAPRLFFRMRSGWVAP